MKCNECYESIESQCKGVCEDVFDADCMFYNTQLDPSRNLKHLGIRGGSSFSNILRIIDRKFGEAINASFRYFSTPNITSPKKITTQKEFVEAVDITVKELKQDVTQLYQSQASQVSAVNILGTRITTNNLPLVSESSFNIVNTDVVKVVLQKIINKVKNIVIPIYTFSDTSTIEVFESTVSATNVKMDVKISSELGNLLTVYGSGLFVPKASAGELMQNLKNSAEGRTLLSEIIALDPPKYKFSVENYSTSPVIVEYINSITKAKESVSVGVGELKNIINVKEIITDPNSVLNITFKGI